MSHWRSLSELLLSAGMLTLHRMQENGDSSVYYPDLSFAPHLCLFVLLLLQAIRVKGEVLLSPEGADTEKGCDPPPAQGSGLSTALLSLYWYSGEETLLKERQE